MRVVFRTPKLVLWWSRIKRISLIAILKLAGSLTDLSSFGANSWGFLWPLAFLLCEIGGVVPVWFVLGVEEDEVVFSSQVFVAVDERFESGFISSGNGSLTFFTANLDKYLMF